LGWNRPRKSERPRQRRGQAFRFSGESTTEPLVHIAALAASRSCLPFAFFLKSAQSPATRGFSGQKQLLRERLFGIFTTREETGLRRHGFAALAAQLTEKFIQQYKGDDLIVPAPAPHAIYTNDDADLKAARQLANKYRVPLVIHLSETKTENDDALRTRGMTPTRLLDSLGILDGPTIAAHGVWLDDADMKILKAHGTGVAHCPSSNMKLASGVAPVLKLLSLGIPTGLGTDGPAGSNNDFNLMEEMNLAANLQKVTSNDPTALNAEQAIAMATILGARVAGLDKETGSLESGKRADLITLRLDRPHAVPLYNVYSQIVYALKGSDVEDVVVNGRPLVRDGRSLTLDSNLVIAKAKEYGARVAASLR